MTQFLIGTWALISVGVGYFTYHACDKEWEAGVFFAAAWPVILIFIIVGQLYEAFVLPVIWWWEDTR